MDKQEAIEKIKNIDTLNINDNIAGQKVDMVIKNQVLGIVSQIYEPQKVTVPKFVAEWIEHCKCNEITLLNSLRVSDLVNEWLEVGDNEETFARAWLDGYDIEKEKLYTVEIPDPNLNIHVVLQKTGEGIVLVTVGNTGWFEWESSKLTESEIKQDFDFLWKFAKEVEK